MTIPLQSDEQVVVTELPDCDIHLRMYDTRVPAAYDAETTLPNRPWAYLCEKCFPRFGPGRLGLGIGQRLILADLSELAFEDYPLDVQVEVLRGQSEGLLAEADRVERHRASTASDIGEAYALGLTVDEYWTQQQGSGW